jgi:hypothetical protein
MTQIAGAPVEFKIGHVAGAVVAEHKGAVHGVAVEVAGAVSRTEDQPAKPVGRAHRREDEAQDGLLRSMGPPGSGDVSRARDKGVFGDVVGISLLSPRVFRLRRKAGAGWERYSLTVEPRSVYLLRGPSRTEWEHSIPGVDALRYSITFRSLRPRR